MYIPEHTLLILLLNKEAYNEHKDKIDLKHLKETFRELSFLYVALIELHEKTEESLTLDELAAYFWVKYPDADKTVYGALLEGLSKASISDKVGQVVLGEINRRKAALKLSETAFAVGQGRATQADLEKAWESIDCEEVVKEQDTFVSTNLGELIDRTYKDQGLRWRLNCLNKSLGSLRSGDFGFIFARPETGKTTFLASEVGEFLSQTDSQKRPILWINNEEAGNKVMLRIIQAFFGVTKDQLLASVKKYEAAFLERTDSRLLLCDKAFIDRYSVERLVDKHNPALVIYDQLTKIKGFKADRNDLMLGEIFQWARELAKRNHAAIGVSQADGSAEGVRYLTMEHVANVKTAVQAEADFILGIGKDHDTANEYIRYLSISKNKLMGDADSREELRHGRFETFIEPTIARYKDVVSFD